MIDLHVLTMRTTAAMGRLADLQRRAEEDAAARPLMKRALKELEAAIEQLRTANEHLHQQAEQLSATRAYSADVANRFEDFIQAVPVPCVWTDMAGTIAAANDAAAALLNVARARLVGKSLMLFLAERDQYFATLQTLGRGNDNAVLQTVLRPRERKPHPAQVTARLLPSDERVCWFFQPCSPSWRAQRSG